ncbi:MAG: hypothetical protein HQ490_01870 [Lutibacter sp.]|nr:hypothetical protein [Lutibacter sp.]
MAYINASLWNDIQSSDATNEKRFAQLGIVDLVKDSTAFVDYIPPSAKAQLASVSSLRNVKIPVLKDQTVTVNSSPSFTIPSNLPDSDVYSFTAYDVFSGFRHYPASYANNMVDSDWARANVMKNVAYAMGNSIETILAARLEDRKTQALSYTTQVSQGDGTFTFDAGTDTLKINKAAQKETMFYNLQELMAANELGGQYRLGTSRAGLAVQKAEALKYGAGNSKDLAALGFLPMDRLYESGNVSASTDIFNGWLVRDGAIGMFENFPFDFVNGTEIAGKKWSISDMEIPFTRLRANIYTNKEATDATALITSGTDSNLQLSHFEEMAIWTRFYVVYRYNSAIGTRPNDIVKVSGLTT